MSWIALAVFLAVIALLLWGGWRAMRSSDARRAGSAPSVAERAAADAGRTVGLAGPGQNDFDGAVTPGHLHEVEHGRAADPTRPPGGGA